MNFLDLTADIQFLPGVGPKRATLLKTELSISSVEDLLSCYPYKYIDRSRFYQIKEINTDASYVQLRGKIANIQKVGVGAKQRLSVIFYDETGKIELVWFKGIRYVLEKLKSDTLYIVFGKPSVFNEIYNIVHPEIEPATAENQKLALGWQAHYNTSEKMKRNFLNSAALRKIMHTIVSGLTARLPETLPEYLINRYNLINKHDAVVNIHFPQTLDLLEKAQHRLKFEELFYIQLDILLQAKVRSRKYKGFVFSVVGNYFNTFYKKHLPFELTNAQKRVVREIRIDVGSGKQMNRLLQGDVGSGKTLVALLSMLIAIDNGFQAALMAPTEILATQHAHTLLEITQGLGINIALLTGSTKKKERELILSKLQSGEIHSIIGTHALIEDTVVFSNLGLVIIDEQHRFGVAQRAQLWKKNTTLPHVLVMTATPIPRTLAMTVYGDLDVSVIDELPPGRKPVQTYHYFDTKRAAMNGFVKQQIELGRQIYIVYPLIQESEKMDFRNLEEGFEHAKSAFPEYKISMVHGKMRTAEKDREMEKFVRGETQIMVATTVIEVGVNVPNASVMIIEGAERFGLSQLHQLRGRVGRGADQSYCILLTSHKLSHETRQRLEVITRTNDGFEISEADMRLRGPGDMNDTRQSGMPFDLKIANLAQDAQLLQYVRNIAAGLLDKDPLLETLENQLLALQIKKIAKNKANWSLIS